MSGRCILKNLNNSIFSKEIDSLYKGIKLLTHGGIFINMMIFISSESDKKPLVQAYKKNFKAISPTLLIRKNRSFTIFLHVQNILLPQSVSTEYIALMSISHFEKGKLLCNLNIFYSRLN